MSEKPVYSTDKSATLEDLMPQEKISSGPFRMRLEKKGRGGKSVTVVYDLPLTKDEAQDLRQKLQTSLGCGGTFKNSTIELRGDVRDKVKAYFEKSGLKIISSGG